MMCKICGERKQFWEIPLNEIKPVCIDCLQDIGYKQDEDTREWYLPEQKGQAMKFQDGEKVVCLRSDGTPEFCIVVDSYFDPFYTVRSENGAEKLMSFAIDDVFKNNAEGLKAIRLRVKERIAHLNNKVEMLDLKIEEAEA